MMKTEAQLNFIFSKICDSIFNNFTIITTGKITTTISENFSAENTRK